MRRFRLRLLWRVNIEALLIASGQNLKRLLKKRGWGRRPFPKAEASTVQQFGLPVPEVVSGRALPTEREYVSRRTSRQERRSFPRPERKNTFRCKNLSERILF